MNDPLLTLAIWAGAILGPIVLLWGSRWAKRIRTRRRVRRYLPLAAVYQRWTASGWLVEEPAVVVPTELSLAQVLYEWFLTDPECLPHWHPKVAKHASLEELVETVWSRVPKAAAPALEERLRQAVRVHATWWGGAEAGWNGRPLVVPANKLTKKQDGLPLLGTDDLSAAPSFQLLKVEWFAKEAPPTDLLLALAVLRKGRARFEALVRAQGNPLLEGLSGRVATDIGRRVGAGIGGVFGPIGSMIGQYVGEFAGQLGAKKVTSQLLPPAVAGALAGTEEALELLGKQTQAGGVEKAVLQAVETLVALGKRLDQQQLRRSRQFLELLAPSTGLITLDEVARLAAREYIDHRAAAEFTARLLQQSEPSVSGAILLQNPWMVRRLPEGPARLTAVRQSLNRTVVALRRQETPAGR